LICSFGGCVCTILWLILGKQEKTKDKTFFGLSTVYKNYKINVDTNSFFSNHFAIFGNSGSGKSCTFAKIIQSVFDNSENPPIKSRFIIFDAYGEYIKAFSHLFLLVMFLLVGIFIIFRLDLNTSFLVLNIMLLLFGICSEELIRLFRSAEMLDARDYVKVLFLKRNRMVKSLLANEDTEQQFSEFLHNEILQNVMAIKRK